MRHSLRLAVAVIVSLFFALTSCRYRGGVEVTSTNFEGEVDQQQNLVFAFNKDLHPDSLLQRWDSTHYIEFSPAVKGAFKWSSSSELQFSPAEGFQPGTDYTATVTRQVLSQLAKPAKLGEKTRFSFHTAPLHVADAHLSYARGAGGAVVSRLDLDFNYPVKVTEAAARIKASSNGNPVSLTAVNGGTGKTVSLQFTPLSAEDKPTPVKLEIAKGIPLAGGGHASDKDTTISEELPSRFTLEVTGISSQHDGTQATVTLNTSQPIHEEGLRNFITIEPAVQFTAEAFEGGISITSDSMRAEQTYQITVNKGLEGELGGKLKDDYSEQVGFGKLEPAVKFVNQKGMYLSTRGYKNLALNLVSVAALQVTVVKVYENNLEHLLRKGNSYGYDYSDEGDGGSFDYYNTEHLGDTIFTQAYQTSKLPGQNSSRVLHLDFSDKIRDRNGVYVISVADKDHYWVQSSKILSLSDIAMIVKEERDNIYVFANSIRDATAMKGIDVSFISTNNQKMWSGKTDGDGMVKFEDIAKSAPGFHTGLITARKDDEYSFIWLEGSRTETSRYDVGGREPNATGLNAMIYAERNLYRPGEVAHVSTIVRTESWETPGEIPVKLRLMMPNGKEFGTMRKILNEEGSTETAFPIPPSAMTGTYTLEVYSGNDILLNSYAVSIEDFIPDRLKADVKIDRPEYSIGDSVQVTMQADNLFGTPAMGRNWEAELNLDKAAFEAKDFSDYDFSIVKELSLSPQLSTGQTDEKGGAHATFGIPQEAADAGMLKGTIAATVFDETGRPVHRYEHLKVYTQPYFIGIKNAYDYVGTRSIVKTPLAAVNKDGKPVSGAKAHVMVIKHEWHTVIEQSGDHYRYVSQQQDKTMEERDILVNGAGNSFNYSPQLSGDYEIRFSLPNATGYVSKTFYAWGYGNTEYSSFEVNNEGNVDIKPDKDKYNRGEDVKLLFTTPFEGRMLVTVERNKVLKHYFVNTDNKSASLTLKGDDDLIPNAYVSATLFRPMDGAAMPLTVAHGFRNISVESTRDKLPVNITVAEKSRSKKKQDILIKTAPHAFVTIAAVDEGILQVKNYTTPDPFQYFYQKVALSVASYDIYPLLLPEIKTTRSSTGGDGAGAGSELRVNPLFVNRIKNVSFWSGILQADGSGNVRYTIDVPQFSGDIRVMALAYKDRGFGGADKHMKVADPVVISAALPRVLSPKDQVVMPVTLSNTTAKDATANVTVTVTGPLGVMGVNRQQVSLPANREGRAVFNIAAAPSIGAAKILVSVQAMGETFTNETEIAVRPPASLQKLSGSGSVAAGQSANLQIPTANFLPSSASGKLIVGKSPLVPFSKNLQYLVQYPYGCVEQTTSAAFPQLYYADLVKSVTGTNNADINPAYNVQQAIAKLQSMQMSNGALMYWPGSGGESWWGSIYAAHFLLEAKKAGYEVNATTLSHLLQYLKARLQKRETEVLYYNRNLSREIAAKGTAYSLYVLALAGEPQQATMNYYKGNPKHLAIDSRYLLAAAYSISGQPGAAKQVLPPAFSGEESNTAFGGSFYSYVRDLGISLNALIDMNPQDPQVGILARTLSQYMKAQPYLNTQENVWGILALGKLSRMANKTSGTAGVYAGGKSLLTTSDNGTLNLKPYLNTALQMQAKGAGQFYYFWEVQGITADGSYKQEDAFLKARRQYFTRTGQPIAGNTFRQNDLIVVKLTLQAQWSGEVENVVLTDMLPAGFEIENTRLTDMPEMKWIKSEATPDYLDYRDDRVNIFTSANSQPRDFYYMVRAVSPGTYQLGPVSADAMYNGAFHSYWGAGVVRVE